MISYEYSLFRTIEYSFKSIKVVDNTLIPFELQLQINVGENITDDEEITTEQATWLEANFQVALTWLKSITSNSIFVSIDYAHSYATSVENTIISTPGDPDECLIMRLLYAKLSTLLGKSFVLGDFKIKDTSESFSYTMNCQDDEQSVLPSAFEYVGEHSLYTTPWWNRYDASVMDYSISDANDRKSTFEKFVESNPLAHITDYVAEMYDLNGDDFYVDRPVPKLLDFGTNLESNSTWEPKIL